MLRNVVAGAVTASGAGALVRRMRRRALPILCYHRVLPEMLRQEYPLADLAVTPETLLRHVRVCTRHYECIPLCEAVERLEAGVPNRRPILTFTFDDGYWDNFEHARSILNEHGVRATFFVISSLAGTNAPPWYDRLARALQCLSRNSSRADFASWLAELTQSRLSQNGHDNMQCSVAGLVGRAKSLDPQARAGLVDYVSDRAIENGWDAGPGDRIMNAMELKVLASDGHEIGSHSRTHPILTQLSSDELNTEIADSRTELARLTSQQVASFAYPNGDHNDGVVEAARRAGYRFAVTTRSGLNNRSTDPLRLRRIYVSQSRLARLSGRSSDSILRLELTGMADSVLLRRRRRAREL